MSVDFTRNQTVPGLVEAYAARHPDAVAVVFGGRRLTYRELNAWANRLARQLVHHGVGPDVPVGICVDRSLETVVGLLAILKAGGAYVPLDPAFPTDRLDFMMRDSGVTVLVHGPSLGDRFPAGDLHRVILGPDSQLGGPEDDENLDTSPDPHHLMYVIYTSGSTGWPKGVAVEHHSVVNLVRSGAEVFRFGPDDVWTGAHSVAFDFSVWETWGCLCTGGRLVVVPLDVLRSPVAFYDLLRRERVTIFNQIPSALRNFLLVGSPDCDLKSSNVRLIICGGEVLLRELATAVLQWGIPLWNFYGPTEGTVAATYCQVTETDISGPSVPIGTAMPNMLAVILDEFGKPVRPGETGELYIGGVGVARGYWGRPDLTSERFIDDHISGTGGRLYRTGDLVRRDAEGPIQFLGRMDTQVKIRGYRIELGEIESALITLPSVRDAVVIAKEDEAGARLIAYVVPAPGRSVVSWELRETLRTRLPEYMVPATFVELANFPIGPTGKLDHAALPVPSKARPDQSDLYVAPRDAIEARLADLWAKALGVDSIGVHDNFFDLGGHSLMAVRLFRQIEKAFGLNLPLAAIFHAPTLSLFADLVRNEGKLPSWSLLVSIQPSGSRPPLYCIHAVGGNVLSYGLLSRYLGNDQPVYGLQSQGLDGDLAPLESVEQMAGQYIKAIRLLQPHGPYFLAGWSFGGTVAYEMACQLVEQGAWVGLLALIDAENSKDAPVGPALVPFEDKGDVAFVTRRIRSQIEVMRQLPTPERIRHFLKKAGIAVSWVARTMKRRFNERRIPTRMKIVNAANTAASRLFIPRAYRGRLVLFRAGEPGSSVRDPFLGWGGVARGGVDVIPVPGDHFTCLEEPHVRVLARRLASVLGVGHRDAAGETMDQILNG